MKISRKDVWLHNSFLGCVAMAQKNMERIIASRTATMDAKILARTISNDLALLYKFLKAKANAN